MATVAMAGRGSLEHGRMRGKACVVGRKGEGLPAVNGTEWKVQESEMVSNMNLRVLKRVCVLSSLLSTDYC